MNSALLLIATGPRYWAFAHNLIASANQYFISHDAILFTDSPDRFDVKYKISIPTAGYPAATLNRYHTFLSQESLLGKYDYLWYSDVDMRWVSPVKEADIFSDGITATLHPGFVVNRTRPDFVGTVGTPERRPESTCYIPKSADNAYYCGGFNGGRTSSFLEMSDRIKSYIDADAEKGIVPIWHDESGLNRYLWENPPDRVLTPSYCHPEGYSGGYGWTPDTYPPVLLALNKDNSDRWKKKETEHIAPKKSPTFSDMPVPGSKSRIRSRMMTGRIFR